MREKKRSEIRFRDKKMVRRKGNLPFPLEPQSELPKDQSGSRFQALGTGVIRAGDPFGTWVTLPCLPSVTHMPRTGAEKML